MLEAKQTVWGIKGCEIQAWRHQHGYSQTELMMELGIRSRQTLSALENSTDNISRVYALALYALEQHPECRQIATRRHKDTA